MSDKPEFMDNGTAPEFFANHVHAIEPMGAVTRIIFAVLRRSLDGDLLSEPPCTVIVPTDQIHAMIALFAARPPSPPAESAPEGVTVN